MSYKLDISDDLRWKLREAATRKRMTLKDFVHELLQGAVAAESPKPLQNISPATR